MNSPGPIPDASYSALFAWHEDRTRVDTDTTIRRVAEPIIAVYLRKLADEKQYEGGIVDVSYLRYLADELLPPEVDAADGRPV